MIIDYYETENELLLYSSKKISSLNKEDYIDIFMYIIYYQIL